MATRNTRQRDRDRAIIRRSGAGCHICGEPIDYTLGWITDADGKRTPHPRMFVADHVIPLASAKTDAERRALDVISNKKAAHWECNDKKRARTYAPIIRRSRSLD